MTPKRATKCVAAICSGTHQSEDVFFRLNPSELGFADTDSPHCAAAGARALRTGEACDVRAAVLLCAEKKRVKPHQKFKPHQTTGCAN